METNNKFMQQSQVSASSYLEIENKLNHYNLQSIAPAK